MKAAQLLNQVQSRAISKTFNGLSAGTLAAFVDQREIVPPNKLMLILWAGVKQSSQTGSQHVALFIASESLRGVAPTDPMLTESSTGPDIQSGLTPIMNSQTQSGAGVTPQQGYSTVLNRAVVVPPGFFLKAVVPGSTGSATAVIVYLDYIYAFIDPSCDVEF